MEGNAMRGIVLFILASWWVGVVTGKFGEQQSIVLSKDPEYAIEDFLIVGEVLLVANSYTTGAQLFVIDVSSSNMTILTSTTICTKMNDTHFYIECEYIGAGLITHNLVTLAYWDGSQVQILPGSGILNPGSPFPIIIPPNSEYFWYYGAEDAIPSVLGLNTVSWTNLSSLLDIPSHYGYEAQQGGFVSWNNSYLICSSGVPGPDLTAPMWKVSLFDGSVMGQLTNPAGPANSPSFCFTDYEGGRSVSLVVDTQTHLSSYVVEIDFDTMQVLSAPLEITYPYWTIYGGTPPWNAGSVNGDYFYVRMTIDKQSLPHPTSEVIQQIKLPDTPGDQPELIDTITFYYEYCHNLIADNNWVYVDTDPATISRWQILPD